MPDHRAPIVRSSRPGSTSNRLRGYQCFTANQLDFVVQSAREFNQRFLCWIRLTAFDSADLTLVHPGNILKLLLREFTVLACRSQRDAPSRNWLIPAASDRVIHARRKCGQCGCGAVVAHHLAKVRVASSNLVIRSSEVSRDSFTRRGEPHLVAWPRGEAAACKAVHTGSNPVATS